MGPILRTCCNCSRKSSSVSVPPRILPSISLALSDVDRLLGLLDQAEHVAHPEDARGHAIRVERLEGVDLLPGADEEDRLAGDRPHRQRRAAARVAVELGQHDAVELARPR